MSRLLCLLLGHRPASRLMWEPLSERERGEQFQRLRERTGAWDVSNHCLRCTRKVGR